MRSTRTVTQLATAVALIGALSSLTACGSDDKDISTTAPTNGASAPAGGDETDTASGGLIDICTKVTNAEVSDLLGAPVTGEKLPFPGCNYSDEEDPRAISIQIVPTVLADGAGGFAGSVTGASTMLQGDAGGALDGVGDEAYAKTGTLAGSDLIRGTGLVRVGTTVVQVDLAPDSRKPLSAEDAQAIVVKALTLVAPKL